MEHDSRYTQENTSPRRSRTSAKRDAEIKAFVKAPLPDLGLTAEEIEAIENGVHKITSLRDAERYIEWDIRIPELAGVMINALSNQRSFAEQRRVKKASSRRRFIGGVLGMLGVTALGASGYFLKDPIVEVIAAEDEKRRVRAEEERIAAEKAKYAYDLSLEANKQLGLVPTALSKNSWRVSYPIYDRNVYYAERENDVTVFEVKAGQSLTWTERAPGNTSILYDTQIKVANFERPSDGQSVIKLSILKKEDVIDEWLLRSSFGEESGLDTSVVMFEQIKEADKVVRYIELSPLPITTATIFQAKILERFRIPANRRRD